MNPFEATQSAVDKIPTSEHTKNKIAACLFNEKSSVTSVNHRPQPLKDCFEPHVRIGDSSQFIHSEVGSIYSSDFKTDGASLVVTDPPCPNCAKGIAESGIRHLYIDHKGLAKDFAQRRGDEFKSLSLLIFERAGIHVSIIHRKKEVIEELIQPPIMTRLSATGIEFFDCDEKTPLVDICRSFRQRQPHADWACAKIREANGKTSGILVFESLPPGVTPQDFFDKKDETAKYSLTIDPVNRLMFYLSRKNAELIDNEIASNLVPSSRGFVNMTGYGVQSLYLGSNETKKEAQLEAMSLLQKHKIMKIKMV